MFQSAGSRNEEGFVNGLDTKGFTLPKSGEEIIANASDAFADCLTFNSSRDGIDVCDDGIGMTLQKLKYMFDAGREHHSGDSSMGVSGIGGLISNYQWSKNDVRQPSTTYVFTKHKDGEYLKGEVPWDLINRDKKYDSQIKIGIMNETEIQQFISERGDREDATGTTLKFPYSEAKDSLLRSQFASVQADCSSLDKLWGIVFGKIPMKILLKRPDGLPPIELKKYNYFESPEIEFYEGKFECSIYSFVDRCQERFVCKDPENESQYIEILQDSRGYTAKPKTVKVDTRKLEAAEIIKFTCGMRTDNNVFDPDHPRVPTAEFNLNSYDSSFMKRGQQGDVIKEFASKCRIYRNDQKITSISLDKFKFSSARGDYKSLLKIVQHRAEISYSTISKQGNRLDRIHDIQENKTQNQNVLPTQYSRLIEHLKGWHAEKILSYMERVIKTHDQQKKEQEMQRKIEEQSRRAEERRIAEEQRRQNEGTQQPVDEIQLVVTGDNDNDNDNDEAVAENGVPTDATEESEESGDEDDEVNEDCDSEQVIMTTDSHNREPDSPNIEEQQPKSSESNESTISEVEESRQYDLKLIQLLSECIATANYTHRNGKMLYEYVMSQREN